jgi:hypothetical protein
MAQYAIALAILIVGLVFAGVPASTLFLALLVLVCPLMMLIMMGGMHGSGDAGRKVDEPTEHRPGDDDRRHRSPKP